MASPSATQATRKRQRSVRVSVAVGLIVLAAALVVASALSGSWLLVTIAAGLGVVLGAAATRITHTELVEARVAAAKDRAAQAKAYLEIAQARSSEHADHVAEVQARLAERQQALDELEEAVSLSQRRAATSVRTRNAHARRADALETQLAEAQSSAQDTEAAGRLRIAELEAEVTALRSELATVTAAWHAAEHQRKHA